MRCDLRTHRECACPVGTCQQEPGSPAPVIIFTWRQHAIVVGFGFLVAASVALSFAPTEQKLKADALDCQERCVTWQR